MQTRQGLRRSLGHIQGRLYDLDDDLSLLLHHETKELLIRIRLISYLVLGNRSRKS